MSDFWSRVERAEDCWTWTGPRFPSGYGRTRIGQLQTTAHRVAWMLTNGPIPSGMVVMHTCDNPPCVRPAHLTLGSYRDNARDMVEKRRAFPQNHPDRMARGERSGRARLTEQQVEEIRARLTAGESRSSIARGYGVRPQTISNIALGYTWGTFESMPWRHKSSQGLPQRQQKVSPSSSSSVNGSGQWQ